MSKVNGSIVTDESAQHNAADDIENLDITNESGNEHEIRDDPAEEEAPVDPRAARLAEIAGSVRKGREEERGYDSEEDDNPAEHLEEGGLEPEPDPEPQAAKPPVVERDGQFFVKAKVNGEEKEIPWEQAIRDIQKNEAADQRLNAAAMKEKELTNKEIQLNQRALMIQQSSQQPAAPSTQDANVQEKQKELARQYRELIMEGEDEKADQVMVEMNSLGRSPATPAIDPNQIAQSAAAQVEQQNEMRRRKEATQNANKTFETDYPEIAGDPNLFALAKGHAKNLWDEEPNLSASEVMVKTGEHIREWVKSMKGPESQEKRIQRKRKAATKTVSGNNQAGSLGQDPAPPKTRSQNIADMRKSRPGAAG